MENICKVCGYRAAHPFEKGECYCYRHSPSSFSFFPMPRQTGPEIKKYIKNTRALKALQGVGCLYMNQLVYIQRKKLLGIKNVGHSTARKILKSVARYNRELCN